MGARVTLTFLFTDIEGSTHLWEEAPDVARSAVERHDAIVRAAVGAHGGAIVKGTGDGFLASFPTASAGLLAATAAQRALLAEPWRLPHGQVLRVRMGLHTGEAEPRDGDYFGSAVNRAARLMSIASGGQTLLSGVTAALVGQRPNGISLRDLGQHYLKDIETPESVWQLDAEGLPHEFPALKSESPTRSNLPAPLTNFVGRAREVAEVLDRLTASRLVTLVAIGGTGKTRLALHVGHQISDAFPDGAFFVDLAGLADANLVPQAIAAAAGIREQAGMSLTDAIVSSLRDRRMLIVLDNCEHLIVACAAITERLLADCPQVTILATSREPLGIAGEVLYPLQPLGLPEAERLFADRAAALVPSFRIDDGNRDAVAEICRRLDGIPLAIELAAARVRILSPREIAARLDERFKLLTGGSRNAPTRQQTLRALIDWSYDLLDDGERATFRRVSVFAGAFSLEAAEAVAGTDALDAIGRLLSRSLIVADLGEATLYRMLETIRAYGRERLAESREDESARRAHFNWCLDLCRRAEPELIGAAQGAWFDMLTAAHDDLRAAMAFGMIHAPRETLEMAKALFWFWQARGHGGEGLAWLEAALARPENAAADTLRQAALLGAGSLSWMTARYDAASVQLAESAAIAERSGDERGHAFALAILGHNLVFADRPAEARRHLDLAVAVARRASDPFTLARALGSQADGARHDGRDADAVHAADEALAIFRSIGMVEGQAFNHVYRAAGLRRNDAAAARADLQEAVELFARVELPYGLYVALLCLADLTSAEGEDAARVLGALDALAEAGGSRGSLLERRMLARLESAAGPSAHHAARAAGRALSRSELVSLALSL